MLSLLCEKVIALLVSISKLPIILWLSLLLDGKTSSHTCYLLMHTTDRDEDNFLLCLGDIQSMLSVWRSCLFLVLDISEVNVLLSKSSEASSYCDLRLAARRPGQWKGECDLSFFHLTSLSPFFLCFKAGPSQWYPHISRLPCTFIFLLSKSKFC